MILSNRANKENVSLALNGNNISRVTSRKFLWVMIDENLKINVHINKVCAKVLSSIGFIKTINYLTASTML